ncbi:MAG TPA: hypothetical protein VFP69_20075 [Streptomyces sp.]|nr:hypothetical protein [Streptomyces sp.]
MTSHIDAQVQAAIAAVRNKRQQRRQQRAELDASRQAGLAARKAAKLRRQPQGAETVRLAVSGQSPKVGTDRGADATVEEDRLSPATGSGRRRASRTRCAVCDRPLKAGRACACGCGAQLCRARHIPPCTDVHGGQCPNLDLPEAS